MTEESKENINVPTQNKTPRKAADFWYSDKTYKIIKWLILGVLLCAFTVFIFGLGIFVGEKRADFYYQWAENYHTNFGGPQMMAMPVNLPDMDFMNDHGVYGEIIQIENSPGVGKKDLIIEDQNNTEKSVLVSPKTTIRNNAGLIQFSDLNVGDNAVIIGSPNSQGQVEAQFIRILPDGTSSIIKKQIKVF